MFIFSVWARGVFAWVTFPRMLGGKAEWKLWCCIGSMYLHKIMTVNFLRSPNSIYLLTQLLQAMISYFLGMLEEKYMISFGVTLLTGTTNSFLYLSYSRCQTKVKWYCFRYIESSKARLYHTGGGSSASVAQAVLLYVFENILKLLHPFMPFVTEELWQVTLMLWFPFCCWSFVPYSFNLFIWLLLSWKSVHKHQQKFLSLFHGSLCWICADNFIIHVDLVSVLFQSYMVCSLSPIKVVWKLWAWKFFYWSICWYILVLCLGFPRQERSPYDVFLASYFTPSAKQFN